MKLVFARRFAAGVIVIVLVPFPVTVAAITPPPVRAIVAVVAVAPVTGSLNVAVMVPALRLAFTALAAGLVAITVGAGFGNLSREAPRRRCKRRTRTQQGADSACRCTRATRDHDGVDRRGQQVGGRVDRHRAVQHVEATFTFCRTPARRAQEQPDVRAPVQSSGVGASADALHEDAEPCRDVVGNWDVDRPACRRPGQSVPAPERRAASRCWTRPRRRRFPQG